MSKMIADYQARYTNNFCQEMVDLAEKRCLKEYSLKEFDFSLRQLNSFCREVLTKDTKSISIVCNHNTFDLLYNELKNLISKLYADTNSYTYVYMTSVIIPTARLPDNIIFCGSLSVDSSVIKYLFAKLKF